MRFDIARAILLFAALLLTPMATAAQERRRPPEPEEAPICLCEARPAKGDAEQIFSAAIASTLGSASGLWLGVLVAGPMAAEYNVIGVYSALAVGTTLGASLGARAINGTWRGAFLGSVVGVGVGYLVGAAASRELEHHEGAVIAYSVTHGLVTALVAEALR